MRTLLLLSLLAIGVPGFAQAPAPAPAPGATPPAAPKQTPAQPRPTPRRRQPAAAARSGIAMVVTDMSGAMLADVHVEVSGAAMAMGDTNSAGQVNFPGLPPGTYRLHFSGDNVTPFEKEVTLAAGKTGQGFSLDGVDDYVRNYLSQNKYY